MKFLPLILVLLLCKPALAQKEDSTRRGMGRGKAGIFFKRYFDFRNAGANGRYNSSEKSTTRLAFPDETNGYTLRFADEFDSFNNKTWQKGQPWGRFHGQQPHQYYGDSEIFVKNGILYLQNRYAPAKFRHADSNIIIPYGTGLINSYHSYNFQYGYFAIRCKNPSGPATWPAFWLTGRYNWPPEIDIFEMYGHCDGNDIHEQTMTVHFGKIENQTKPSLTKSVNLSADTDTAFHIYSCLWEPEQITFYTDGVKLKTIKLNAWMQQFYREPMYLVVNNAVDHRYLNCINQSKLPCALEVDWIRVYERK